ncbi:MAG TPA: hypothetical protein VJU86_07585 [Pyrinomonadaceae bacterium]|nr:hypothetical protein [Pyrinomonadaceae bacterium]
MSTNFDLAPPPKTVDGLNAVPIDIQTIDAIFTFDGASETASADATISYTVGPTAGNPIFDLRQNITQAWVDGAIFPVAQVAHHDFAVGAFMDFRVIEAVQAAGSVHTLRVQYDLALPDSELTGGYPPALEWEPGPKLKFVFGLSDLRKARYVEAWLPANLIFDQFRINLEVQITGTMAAHSVITNGTVSSLGLNHWQIDYPARFSASSPLLEVRGADTLTLQTDTVLLPVSGKTVTIEAWKPFAAATNLTTQINEIKAFLTENETDYGAYLHDDRFVAFFNGGGMEYEGGTTTSTGDTLNHETFHSWFARGLKPASHADGWWDEGFTSFHDDGADDAIPFDFSDPPVLLCSRDPWQRDTPDNSYGDGSNFWRGMASLLSVANLNALMGSLYDTHNSRPVSTQIIEEYLLSTSGNAQVVDAFHRFVYGLADPSPSPDLWLKDDPGHTGADEWDGAFWDSPDLWIRNDDDGGMSHQSPEYGQDNWFHARVRNKAAAGEAEHFVITFHSKGFAGTQFVYPADFLPCIAAKAEFDLGPGEVRIVKARWPRALVPPEGTHTCLLASLITREDHPGASRHVWEDNNLGQKNLTVVDMLPDMFMIVPIVIGNWLTDFDSRFQLEVWEQKKAPTLDLSLIHRSRDFFKLTKADVKRFEPSFPKLPKRETTLDCGAVIVHSPHIDKRLIITSDYPELVQRRFPESWEAKFSGRKPAFNVEIPLFTQKVVGLKVGIPSGTKLGESIKVHLVQRHSRSKKIVGGVAVQVNVRSKDRIRVSGS